MGLEPDDEFAAPLQDQRKEVGRDQECWVTDRLYIMVRLVKAIERQRKATADDRLINGAIHSLVNGAAVEIIETLGLHPSYVNLQRVPFETHR
jgi:hypothetical protein